MKITSEGRAQAVRYLTDTGGNPVIPNPDSPTPDDPVDVALDADAFVPIAPAGSSGFVQEHHLSTPDTDGTWIAVLDTAPTPGNTMVVGYSQRGWNGEIQPTAGGIIVPDGWTYVGFAICGPGNGGATGMWYRVVQSGDDGSFSVVKSASNAAGGWIAEFAMGTLHSSDVDGPTGGATSYTTPSLTATAPDQVFIAAIAQSTSTGVMAEGSGETLIATENIAGGSVGPSYLGEYKIVSAGSVDGDATSTDAQSWASVVALFNTVGTDLTWVPAPLVVDDDDATYEVSSLTQEVRLDLGSAQVLESARLLIGFDTSGEKAIELWASNDSDLAGAVLIDTETTHVTATPGGGTTGTLVAATPGALAAAVSAASPGDTLRLRGGDHLVDDIIYVNKELYLTNYTGEVPRITHPTARPEFLFFTDGPNLLDGIVFTGVGGYGDVHGSALVSMQAGSHDLTIQNCEFHGASNMGATQQLIYHHNTSGSGATIQNCLIDGHGSGGFGVHLYPGPGPDDVLVQNNTIRNFPAKSGVVVWTDSSGIQILDNSFANCGSAVRHHNSLGTDVDGNVGINVGAGLEVDDATNLTIGTNDWNTTTSFPASGSFGPDELLFTITDTTAYRYWEFRGPVEDTRTFTVSLYAHTTPTDPTGFQLTSEKGFPDGYAGLDSTSRVPVSQLPFIEELDTLELDDSLVLAPDGAGGVEFRAETGGGGGSSIYIDVTAYGAVGDGTTDDTTAIQAAIADMVDGCTLFFPATADYYKITDTLDITTAGCVILGSGSEYGTRVHMATTNTTAFSVIPSGLDGTRNQTNLIRGLLITGPGGNSSGRGVYASSDVHLEDVGIAGFYDGLYWGSSTFYSRAYGCFFTDMQRAAVVMDGTNNCTLDTCRITGDFGGGGLIGPVVTGVWIACPSVTGLTNRVVNCSIEYFSGDGILLEGGSGVELVGNYFETQESSTGHAHIKFSASNTNRATRISSNYFQGDGTSGFVAIALDHCTDTVISSNRFGINSAIGITSTGSTDNVLLFGNYNSPAGTFSLPSNSYTLDPASPPVSLDNTLPEMLHFGDSPAAGSGTTGARIDHVHGMPDSPSGGGGGQILISDSPSTPLIFGDLIQNEAQDDLVYADS